LFIKLNDEFLVVLLVALVAIIHHNSRIGWTIVTAEHRSTLTDK